MVVSPGYLYFIGSTYKRKALGCCQTAHSLSSPLCGVLIGKGGAAVAYQSRAEFRRLGLIHRINAVATFVLLASGLLLYAEPLRGALAPVRVPLRYLHLAVGGWLALYAAATLRAWGPFLVRRGLHVGRRLNAVLTLLWLSGWTLTGVLIYLRGRVDFAVSDLATAAHGWLTWLAIPWLVLHTAFRLAKVRRPDERPGKLELAGWVTHPATRRAVLWAGVAGLGLLVARRWFGALSVPADPAEEPAEPPVDPATLPGGGMKGKFRLYFVNDTVPRFNPETWRLTVAGKTYTWAHFQALPRQVLVRNFHCVTGWSVFQITWEGVLLRDLLQDAGVERSPVLIFRSGDGEYTESLTWDQARQDDVVLADRMDGRALPRFQGGPVRLVVPQMYGYKSAKWVEAIDRSDDLTYQGYWEELGYPTDAYLEKGEKITG